MKRTKTFIALMLSFVALMISCKKDDPVKPVEPTEILVEKVNLSDSIVALLEGDTFQLSFTVEPQDAVYDKAIWTSSDVEVATVDTLGLVTAVAEGEAMIKIAVDGKEDECKVFVNKEVIHVENVILNETSLELFEGETFQLTFTVEPENAMYENVVWSSTDEAKATVDENGLVTAVAAGAVGIKVAVDDVEATCILLVKEPVAHVENVILNETSIELMEGATSQLSFTVEPQGAVYETVAWTTSNADVATVDENGLVTAVAEGNAEIKVTVDGVEAVCNVKVNAEPEGLAFEIQVSNITPNNAEFTVIPNDNTKTYYVYGMTKSKFDQESTYSELGIFGFEQSWFQFAYGNNWISAMLDACHTGTFSGHIYDFNNFIGYDTEFVIYVYGFDEGGVPTSEVFTHQFTTAPMNPSNNDITVTIENIYAHGVDATFHTTNNTKYYVSMQKKTYVNWWIENDNLVNMALDIISADSYIQLLSGDYTIHPDGYYHCNSANTDYYLIYFSFDEEYGIRSDIHLELFHTAAE